MLDAIDEVEEYVADRDFAGYLAAPMVRRAVERCVEIVSEASRHIPDDVKQVRPEIEWQSSRAIGNIMRHEYGRVDDHIVWRIAVKFLPELKLALRAISEQLEEPDDT